MKDAAKEKMCQLGAAIAKSNSPMIDSARVCLEDARNTYLRATVERKKGNVYNAKMLMRCAEERAERGLQYAKGGAE